MATAATSSPLRPFLAGAAAAYASVLLYRAASKTKRRTQDGGSPDTSPPSDAASVSSSARALSAAPAVAPAPAAPLMDSPDLDLRMIRKAEGAIRLRTSRLVVIVERCTNDHNYSAILRSVEALGVQTVCIVDPPAIQRTVEGVEAGEGDDPEEEETTTMATTTATNGGGKIYRSTGQVVKKAKSSEAKDRALHHLFAKRATEWLTVREFADTTSCLKALRDEGYEVWATDLGQEAVPLTREDLLAAAAATKRNGRGGGSGGGDDSAVIPRKLAIAFGTEAVGCTAELLTSADLRVYLPLRGFADSLNLSVATALVVHHLFLQDPTLVGSMPENEREELRRKWYAKLCRQRLLGAKEKKEMQRLRAYVTGCEELERQRKAGKALQVGQLNKMGDYAEKKARLEEMDRDLDEKASRAVEGLVLDPPQPITDMRRADEHRVTFAGKKTKQQNADAWGGMAATAKPKTAKIEDDTSTSKFFRSRLEEAS